MASDFINYHLSTITYQLSTITYQLSLINYNVVLHAGDVCCNLSVINEMDDYIVAGYNDTQGNNDGLKESNAINNPSVVLHAVD